MLVKIIKDQTTPLEILTIIFWYQDQKKMKI